MIISLLTGLIIIAGIATLTMLRIKRNSEENNKFRIANIIATAVLVVLLIVIPPSFHSINTGEVAVVKQFGKVIDVKGAGLNFDLWFLRKYQKYDTKVQNLDIETMAYSSDAQTMDLFLTIQYTISQDKVIDIATQYGRLGALEDKAQRIAIAEAKTIMSRNKAMDIIAKRGELSADIEDAMRKAIDDQFYINISSVTLTNIDFSDAFEKAVEDKMIAEQDKLKADYTNDTKIATAEASAKAKIVEAEAQAKANKIVQDSLTDRVLQSRFYDKWDGKLPSVMSDGAVITDIKGSVSK